MSTECPAKTRRCNSTDVDKRCYNTICGREVLGANQYCNGHQLLRSKLNEDLKDGKKSTKQINSQHEDDFDLSNDLNQNIANITSTFRAVYGSYDEQISEIKIKIKEAKEEIKMIREFDKELDEKIAKIEQEIDEKGGKKTIELQKQLDSLNFDKQLISEKLQELEELLEAENAALDSCNEGSQRLAQRQMETTLDAMDMNDDIPKQDHNTTYHVVPSDSSTRSSKRKVVASSKVTQGNKK